MLSEIAVKYFNIIENVFIQGDSRYFNPYEIEELAYFLSIDGISIEKFDIDGLINENKKSKWAGHRGGGVQHREKELLTSIFKKLKFKIYGYEVSRTGGIPDVTAIKGNLIVVGECQACRISKAWEYLVKDNVELWIFQNYCKSDMSLDMKLFIVKRGKNWNKVKEYLDHQLDNLLDKINYTYEDLKKTELLSI